MVRKKVDERLRTLLENGVKKRHRSLVVLVGDGGKDQVVNIHYILSKLQVKARPSVLWCYKKDLGFSTHKKKRMRQIKKQVQRGLYDPERDDPFELFMASTNIQWRYYRDSDKVLGQTFGMCVLQDFEALTPNLLARTVETVEGGGVVVLLLKRLDSLRQLYTMSMDVHARFRTEAYNMVKPRFNERFILSLASCKACVVMDDELNILPISKHIRSIEPVEGPNLGGADPSSAQSESALQLANLKESLAGTQPASNLVSLARTVDQAQAILTFIESVADKSLASTVTLTAGRGRGKSAALGLGLASAIAFGYSNVFVTSPSPENLKTVFEFLFKGLDAIAYKEHIDYEIIQSTNPDFNKAVVRVNIFHEHRQTIQYIDPHDSAKLAQAELVVVDEAAAIPLPLVRSLIGPYLVFMSSTIDGYEGTGRSLSVKLINQLRVSSARAKSAAQGWRTNEFMYRKGDKDAANATAAAAKESANTSATSRTLREIELKEPIRYANADPVESWLNHTLCLEATNMAQILRNGTPHPDSCSLFAVDRDTLFSHHAVSEALLQRIWSLFVASHYKNSPNDLQLLSDAPAHRLFVLLGPQKDDEDDSDDDSDDDESDGEGDDEDQGEKKKKKKKKSKKKDANDSKPKDQLPDILCAVQIALEGGISRKHVEAQLKHGNRASGDLVPWTISQQFQDNDFARLDGARVVRIASHPSATRMGYGKRAMELLRRFYQGELVGDDTPEDDGFERVELLEKTDTNLLKEKIRPRKALQPLLVDVADLRPPRLHYMSVSYGLTPSLFSFWSTTGFRPVYLRQTANDLTGEFTNIVINPLDTSDLADGTEAHWEDRYINLLSGPFRKLDSSLSLSIVSTAMKGSGVSAADMDAGREVADTTKQISARDLQVLLSPHDIRRLDAYSRNLVDFHLITDLLPDVARIFFEDRLPSSMSLSFLQRAILLGMGLQRKSVDDLGSEYDMPGSQLLALFNKSVRKLHGALDDVQKRQIESEVDQDEGMQSALDLQSRIRSGKAMQPIAASMSAEQSQEGTKTLKKMSSAAQDEAIKLLDLEKYAIKGDDADLALATKNGIGNHGIVSVKVKRPAASEETSETPKAAKKARKSTGDSGRKFQRSSHSKHKRSKK
ncbi:RNA cytidine acetyltransferase [Hondaea fermentalgiana]|uniref:RNA cytidine acetyltransferase n=1 Tax=Hondaea fermentalgiana TaxID=2315210 RepID=A0A2R5GY24_9STRA|nr:RNA cytidine acetyltransferase [Hondaea fermentalgiana]|eukprot:GBG32874.1 RNA cytidine acetyltransferase [Hondaea fermentalgiana]